MELAYEQIVLIGFAIVLLFFGFVIVEKVMNNLSIESEGSPYKAGCYFSAIGKEEILSILSSNGSCFYNATSKGFSLFDFDNAVVDEECKPLPKVIVLGRQYFKEGEIVVINKTADFLLICPPSMNQS